MRYYIFGSNKSKEIKTTASKAEFVSEALEIAVEKFNKYSSEIRYKHMYLVADYGCIGNKMFSCAQINPKSPEDSIPFFIIMEYHIGQDRSKLVRSDHTMIMHERGYTQIFDNNLRAARVFENCIYGTDACEFSIAYVQNRTVDTDNSVNCIYNRSIAKSDDIRHRRNLGLEKYINRFIIDTPNWDFYPIEPRKRIMNFKLEKPNVSEGGNTVLMVSAPGK